MRTVEEIVEYFRKRRNRSRYYLLKNLSKEEIEMMNSSLSLSEDICETLYLYLNDLKEIPKCPICGENRYFKDISEGYRITCNKSLCSHKKGSIKTKETKLERYGNPTYNNMEKNRQTCLERYGSECYFKTKEFYKENRNTRLIKYGSPTYNNREKAKETCIQRYGDENPHKNKEVVEKDKQTRFERYGDRNYNNRDKCRQTFLERYGVDWYTKTEESKKHLSEVLSSPEVLDKMYKSKKRNNSFKRSNDESNIEDKLRRIYSDLKTQYRDERYPYHCDFYIPSKDLFIEINFHWTHGKHLYDSNNIEDNKKIEQWKSKGTRYYNNAINTWTKLDIQKYNCALENNLNYLIFYNMKHFDEWYATIN